MSDSRLGINGADPRRAEQLPQSPAVSPAPQTVAAPGRRPADGVEPWRPAASLAGAQRVPRSGPALIAAMKRAAASVMPDPPAPPESVKLGIETVAVHGGVEAGAHLAGRLGKLALSGALSVASPFVTFAEYGTYVLEQNERGEVLSRRRAAAQGFGDALGVALGSSRSGWQDLQVDDHLRLGRAKSHLHHELDCYGAGVLAAYKFSQRLLPEERATLMATLGALPRGTGEALQDNAASLSNRVQRHMLGAKWDQP